MKNKMRKLLSCIMVLVMVFICAGCGDSEENRDRTREQSGTGDDNNIDDDYNTPVVNQPVGDGSFTLLIYMCGSDLESQYGAATDDINEILYAEHSEDLNVVIQTGGASVWYNDTVSPDSVQRFYADESGLTLLDDIGLQDMTDEKTLADFISFGVTNYPADRYGLILWNHGGGTVSGYGVDEYFPDSDGMQLNEISDALRSGGVHFDFVGFDACLMGTVETMDTLQPYADYLIASEETEPGTGWYYTNFISTLSADTTMSVPDFGKIIVDDYMNPSYGDVDDASMLSVLDLSKTDEVVDALNNFMDYSNTMLENGNYSEIAMARYNAVSFGEGDFEQIDMGSFVTLLDESQGSDLLAAIDDAVVYNQSGIYGTTGIAMYFPYDAPEVYSDVITAIEDTDFNGSAYETFYSNFLSVEVNGQNNAGGGSTNPYGYSDYSDEYDDYYDVWYNDDTSDYYSDDDYSSVSDDLEITDKGDYWALELTDDDWEIITTVYQQTYIDDGEGYFELGYDDYYSTDDDGALIVEFDYTWLYLNDCIVPYYASESGQIANGTRYSSGVIPAVLNDKDDIEIIVYWYENSSEPEIKGYRMSNKTSTMSSRDFLQFKKGDVIDFYFDYYTYDGDYEASYAISDNTLYYDGKNLELYYGEVDESETAEVCFYIKDIYNNEYWTETLRYE